VFATDRLKRLFELPLYSTGAVQSNEMIDAVEQNVAAEVNIINTRSFFVKPDK
jgi:hypothetical protein